MNGNGESQTPKGLKNFPKFFYEETLIKSVELIRKKEPQSSLQGPWSRKRFL